MVVTGTGRAWFERIAWPDPGGMEDQAARLLQQLDWIAQVATEELHENFAHHQREAARRRRRARPDDDVDGHD